MINDILQLSSEMLTTIVLLLALGLIIKLCIYYLVIKTAVKNAIIEARLEIKRTPDPKNLTPQEVLEREMNGWK